MARKLLEKLMADIVHCEQCPRLVEWREQVANEKRAAFRDQEYWGKPLPSFGDRNAQVIVCGLAPAAHGANRTGRMFTGDRSGDWLYAALYRSGFANQPESTHRKDGLELHNCYITACVRCAPPANKPSTEERNRCLNYLMKELPLLRRARVILCLGAFAWSGVLRVLRQLGFEYERKPKFSHGAEATIGRYILLGCYHPSQQNTFTGRLTEQMLDKILRRAKALASAAENSKDPVDENH